MGTHVWNNGSSRRGRRMSIDLPNLHITPGRNAENFAPPGTLPSQLLPFMPPAYMNGKQRHAYQRHAHGLVADALLN